MGKFLLKKRNRPGKVSTILLRVGLVAAATVVPAIVVQSETNPSAAVYVAPAKPGDRVAAGYVPPRLSIGQPDLQGAWTSTSLTNLVRPSKFRKLIMTAAEETKAAKLDPRTGYSESSEFWTDYQNSYANVKGTWRTSWTISPSDGHIPYRLDPEGKAALASLLAPRGTGYDNPEEQNLMTRCIGVAVTNGPPMINHSYNSDIQITQSPDTVLIETEEIHNARNIRLNAKHGPPEITQISGDSIGWWDRNTLVVETVNIHPEEARDFYVGWQQVRVTSSGKVIERFTRYSDSQILYEWEVDDPKLYAQVWKGEMALNRMGKTQSDRLFEYACHEGNHAAYDALATGRVSDAKGLPDVPDADYLKDLKACLNTSIPANSDECSNGQH